MLGINANIHKSKMHKSMKLTFPCVTSKLKSDGSHLNGAKKDFMESLKKFNS